MIYINPLVELHLGNIYLQNRSDWPLIADDLDPSSLGALGLCQITVSQSKSAKDAVDLFLSKVQTRQGGRHPLIPLISLNFFVLDIVSLPQHDFLRIQNILLWSSLKHLHIECASFDLSLSDAFAQVLGSVPWSTLTSLVFSGIDINAWTRLLAVCMSQVQRLVFQGAGSAILGDEYLKNIGFARLLEVMHEFLNRAAGLLTNNAQRESTMDRKRDERSGDEDGFGTEEWDRKKAQRI